MLYTDKGNSKIIFTALYSDKSVNFIRRMLGCVATGTCFYH